MGHYPFDFGATFKTGINLANLKNAGNSGDKIASLT